jgi:hypothetical protein
MTEHKKRTNKTKLACQWVDEDGFEINPAPPSPPAKEPRSNTFVLKSKSSPPSTQLPGG